MDGQDEQDENQKKLRIYERSEIHEDRKDRTSQDRWMWRDRISRMKLQETTKHKESGRATIGTKSTKVGRTKSGNHRWTG